MLDQFIVVIGEYITQYIASTTIYKFLLVMITLSWVTYPWFGLTPVCISITCGVMVWLVSEYLYTRHLEEEVSDEQ